MKAYSISDREHSVFAESVLSIIESGIPVYDVLSYHEDGISTIAVMICNCKENISRVIEIFSRYGIAAQDVPPFDENETEIKIYGTFVY